VTLLGAGFGGTEPYTFSWSASGGTLAGGDAPTAQIATSGLAAGTYSATVTVRDAAGASATDAVKFVLYNSVVQALLDQTKADGTPGVLSVGAPGTINFPFAVLAGTAKFDVLVSWANSLNDYDIRVLRPDGSQETNHGSGAGVPEEGTVVNPAAGTWTIAVDKFATVPDSVRTQVTGTLAPPDPRPRVTSGGPYKFALGAAQGNAGSGSGGACPGAVG